jgi:membrane protease subunit (stomatin/prohibitin family)
MHRDYGPMSGALLVIDTSSWAQAGADAVWATVDAAHARLAPIVDSGADFVAIVANGTAAVCPHCATPFAAAGASPSAAAGGVA